MKMLIDIARSRIGSALLFGGAFFAAFLALEGVTSAIIMAVFAVGSWYAAYPKLIRRVGNVADA